jgi:hypothetical protein
MSLIEKTSRIRTKKCEYCKVVFLVNHTTENYHKLKKCIKND